MFKKLIATIVSSAFIFILVMTAWDYCPPKPDHKNISSVSSTQGIYFKNPHHPCTSLKDSYEFSTTISELASPYVKSISTIASIVSLFPSIYTGSILNNHSPPLIVLSFSKIPLYQLNCNLRI